MPRLLLKFGDGSPVAVIVLAMMKFPCDVSLMRRGPCGVAKMIAGSLTCCC